MRVIHLTTVHGAFDDRIFFKQCRSLVAAGHEVIEVAPVEKELSEDGVRIVAVNVPQSRLLRATLGAWRAYRLVRSLRPDLVHFHDPELLFVGLRLKRKGILVVYDMHELVHRQILDKSWLGPLWFRRMMAGIYDHFERKAVRRFDAIVLAESRYTDEMLPRHPAFRDKFTVLRNFPVLAVIDQRRAPVQRSAEFTVIYVGGLSEARGIRTLIEAVGRLEGVRLSLLGAWSSDAFRRECEALAAYRHVDYKGLLRMDEVYEHIRAADLGACVLHPLPNYIGTEPIKTYEYLACGLPLLLSDFPHWKDRFGPWAWFVDPMDVEAVAQAIRAAMADPGKRKSMAASGRKTVEEERCWEREAERLIDLYRRLAR